MYNILIALRQKSRVADKQSRTSWINELGSDYEARNKVNAPLRVSGRKVSVLAENIWTLKSTERMC